MFAENCLLYKYPITNTNTNIIERNLQVINFFKDFSCPHFSEFLPKWKQTVSIKANELFSILHILRIFAPQKVQFSVKKHETVFSLYCMYSICFKKKSLKSADIQYLNISVGMELNNSLEHCLSCRGSSRKPVLDHKSYVKRFNAQISTTY